MGIFLQLILQKDAFQNKSLRLVFSHQDMFALTQDAPLIRGLRLIRKLARAVSKLKPLTQDAPLIRGLRLCVTIRLTTYLQ